MKQNKSLSGKAFHTHTYTRTHAPNSSTFLQCAWLNHRVLYKRQREQENRKKLLFGIPEAILWRTRSKRAKWPDRCHSTGVEFMDSGAVYLCLRKRHLLECRTPLKRQSIPILQSKALKFSFPGHCPFPQDEDTVGAQSSGRGDYQDEESDLQQTLKMGYQARPPCGRKEALWGSAGWRTQREAGSWQLRSIATAPSQPVCSLTQSSIQNQLSDMSLEASRCGISHFKFNPFHTKGCIPSMPYHGEGISERQE